VTPPEDEFNQTIVIRGAIPSQLVPATDTMGHYLVMLSGAEPGKLVEIGSEPITIGRDQRQTLVLADAELSRRHARVSLVNGEVIAEDLGSTNGTFIGPERITKPTPLPEGAVLRVGSQLLKHERRSQRGAERTLELDRDLRRASNYVLSLLPPPITEGPVRTEWRFVPSASLGGDAFGYHWLDEDSFAFYLIDVSGHGVGSAMHSVAVMNVLRQRALPNVDFHDPGAVLSNLNTRFQMDSYNGMFFTMWYGVYQPSSRTLTYGSAGHHPAYLVPADRRAEQPLGLPALMIGALTDQVYQPQQTTVPEDARIYLFSDGVFEIVTKDESRWALSDFLPLLLQPPVPGASEADRLYRTVKDAARTGPLDDDFSLMAVTFPSQVRSDTGLS
jgi:serine phosphatase RsbU (regulator of sigma subunit)